MIHLSETVSGELPAITELSPAHLKTSGITASSGGRRFALWRQLGRFGLVGVLNTLVDLLALNILLLLFPSSSSFQLFFYNALAYGVGAVNSFLFNKCWTFRQGQRTTRRELWRFTLMTLLGMAWSSGFIWLTSAFLHPVLLNPTVWANVSKVCSIVATMLGSYLVMRLWVFASRTQTQSASLTPHELYESIVGEEDRTGSWHAIDDDMPAMGHYSLSVVLPAFNEEEIIARSVTDVVRVLQRWQLDFEVLVVNDGSVDRTGAILTELAVMFPQVRVLTHEVNQGYGSALTTGFKNSTKELTFLWTLMDSSISANCSDSSGLSGIMMRLLVIVWIVRTRGCVSSMPGAGTCLWERH